MTLDDAVTPQQLTQPDPIAEAIRRVEALPDARLLGLVSRESVLAILREVAR